VPYIGSTMVTPYSLMGLGPMRGRPGRAYPDSSSLAMYNATSYTFLHKRIGSPPSPPLQSYRNPLSPADAQQPPLWATVLGSDGYYPLGILSPCASDDPRILPGISGDGKVQPASCDALKQTSPKALKSVVIYPSRLWQVLCVLVLLLCLFHTGMLVGAAYWSPITRDLAIRDNDQPQRRSTYVHVATVALVSVAVVLSFPAISLGRITTLSGANELLCLLVLSSALLSVVVTFWKTWRYIGWVNPRGRRSKKSSGSQNANHVNAGVVYLFLNVLPWTTLIALPPLWWQLCVTESTNYPKALGLSLVGLSFSYRCINPGSGVSPVVPVLLLLLSWYLWAFFHTWRLRFSEHGRPWLPGRLADGHDVRFYVSDEDLAHGRNPREACLYRNITCPMITREVLCRFRRYLGRRGQGYCIMIDILVVTVYACFIAWFSCFTPIDSPDHFLWKTGKYISSPYEFLVGILFFPLMVTCVAGCLRLILIWGALNSGLLERLENQPIRFAFSRLKVMGWMAMLRHGGLQEQWRDMARSLESMRQMLHQKDLTASISKSDLHELDTENGRMLEEIAQLRARIAEPPNRRRGTEPHDFDLMQKIEIGFATFSQKLLSMILIPYWKNERIGLVASQEIEELPIKARRSETHVEHPSLPMELHAGPPSEEPARILVAEEFLAIRYISLIRAVLSNMRYLMIFISASFVLAMVAWNSYPFQPRQWVDWMFTGLMLTLGTAIIWVFAQMHRNPILSRITDTKANELGWDFYLRIASYGALPVLAWLTYQFPDIGSIVSKFLQPGVPVIK
jgi:hypothetical protein